VKVARSYTGQYLKPVLVRKSVGSAGKRKKGVEAAE
jgi:hypothetical protein